MDNQTNIFTTYQTNNRQNEQNRGKRQYRLPENKQLFSNKRKHFVFHKFKSYVIKDKPVTD